MINVDGSSFRDRSGFVFTYHSRLYRQINYTYRNEYTHLIKSKLYDILVTKNLLIPHREVRKTIVFTSESIYKIIEPQQIPFISYPYEWCFSQFKQAALATLEIYLDGIPLELVSKLLPLRAKVNPRLSIHLLWHSRLQQISRPNSVLRTAKFDRRAYLELVDSLLTIVQKLSPPRSRSAWVTYNQSSYRVSTVKHKQQVIEYFVNVLIPTTVWDIGAYTGYFSRAIARRNIFTLAIDADHDAVEENYHLVSAYHDKNLLPLWMDVVNPSASIGWAHAERKSLSARGPADLTMMLALIHHIVIGHNVPFSHLAKYLHDISKWLLIEYVSKEDSQVKQLLTLRDDIFADY